MVLVSRAPIKPQRGIVSPIDFEMDGIYTHLACFLLDEGDGLPAIATAPVGGIDVQLVDESVMAVKFKAEPNRQRNISDGFVFFAE